MTIVTTILKPNDHYLITTNHFFVAPDGSSYRAVWGKVKFLNDDILPIKTNKNSTNWFIMVGSEEDYIIIGGCQIHYVVRCEKPPFLLYSETWDTAKLDEQGKAINIKHRTSIYVPDEKELLAIMESKHAEEKNKSPQPRIDRHGIVEF